MWLALVIAETFGDAATTQYGVNSGVVREANPIIRSMRFMWTVMVPLRILFVVALNGYAPAALPLIAAIWAIPLLWNPWRIWQQSHLEFQ